MNFKKIVLCVFFIVPVYSQAAFNTAAITREAFGARQPTIYPLPRRRSQTTDQDKMAESAQMVYNNELSRLWSATSQGGYLDAAASTIAVEALSRGEKAMSDAHDSVNIMFGSQTTLPDAQSKKAQSVVDKGELEAASDILAAASAISSGIRLDNPTGILQPDSKSTGSVVTSPSKGAQAIETSSGSSSTNSTAKANSAASKKSDKKTSQASTSKQSSSGLSEKTKGTLLGVAFAPAILLSLFVM